MNNEITIVPPEGYVIDEKCSTPSTIMFVKSKQEVTQWEDLESIEGYFVTSTGSISELCKEDTSPYNQNTWVTKEQAEACIALCMLCQLMSQVNGGWVPNWEAASSKYIISVDKDSVFTDKHVSIQCFLAFKDSATRDTFLENHIALIEQAKPLL